MILASLPGIVTFLFLLVMFSYYVLIFIRPKKAVPKENFRSLTVIVPAHNEEMRIADTIESVLSAEFDGKKDIIVVDDGSRDGTARVVSSFRKKGVRLIRKAHTGKADSINAGLKAARGELVAIVDADSIIRKDALIHLTEEVSRPNVAAATGVILVRNRREFIGMWLHIEQVYNSLIRFLLSKINANITLPGPLTLYRRKALVEIGGFSTEGFSEDQDVTIRIIRKGYRVGFSPYSFSETIMPTTGRGFLKQRTRFARGLINLIRRHMRLSRSIIDIYTLPLYLFVYVQAVVMGSFTIFQIVSGYFTYFASKGEWISLSVGRFLIDWLSLIGTVRWIISVFSGATPINLVTGIGIASTMLSYPLFIYAIIRFEKKINVWHLIPFVLMPPFWLIIMLIYVFAIPEYFRKKQRNIWEKVT